MLFYTCRYLNHLKVFRFVSTDFLYYYVVWCELRMKLIGILNFFFYQINSVTYQCLYISAATFITADLYCYIHGIVFFYSIRMSAPHRNLFKSNRLAPYLPFKKTQMNTESSSSSPQRNKIISSTLNKNIFTLFQCQQ